MTNLLNRKIFWVASLSARMIPVLAVAFVTRLYSPDEFGQFQVLIAYCGAAVPFVNIKLSFVVAKLRSDAAVKALAVLVMWIIPIPAIFVSGLLYIVFQFAGYSFSYYMVFAIVTLWALTEFLVNIQSILNRFELSSTGTLLQAVTTEVSKLTLGAYNPVASSLSLSWLAGYALSLLLFIKVGGFQILHMTGRTLDLFGKLVRRNASKIFYRVCSSAVTMLNTRALIIIGALFLDPRELGLLAIAMLFVSFPAGLIAQPISKLNFTHIRNLLNKNNYEAVFKDTLQLGLLSFSLSLPIVLFFQFAFAPLFAKTFSEFWYESAGYVKILSFLIPMQFMSSTVVQTYSLLDRDKVMLGFNVAVFGLYLGSLLIGQALDFPFEQCLYLLVLTHSGLRLAQFGLLLKITHGLRGSVA